MSGARVVDDRAFRPSVDQTPMPPYETGIPFNTTVTVEQVEAARHIVTTKARSDADALIPLNALGIDEVRP